LQTLRALPVTIEGSTTTYHHQDHFSVRVNTDSSGAVVGEQGHYPFGEFWYSSSTTTKWRFTSYERDSESGNDYAMFRYHSNRLGRFLTPDPIAGSAADPQSLNRYAYVLNDPVNLIDPLGLACYWWVEWERLVSSDGKVGPKILKRARFLGCDARRRVRLLPISLAEWDDLHTAPDRPDREVELVIIPELADCLDDPSAPGCSLAPSVGQSSPATAATEQKCIKVKSEFEGFVRNYARAVEPFENLAVSVSLVSMGALLTGAPVALTVAAAEGGGPVGAGVVAVHTVPMALGGVILIETGVEHFVSETVPSFGGEGHVLPPCG
jgi:RHS repeat-associated protein